jgi:hypothetical protein
MSYLKKPESKILLDNMNDGLDGFDKVKNDKIRRRVQQRDSYAVS